MDYFELFGIPVQLKPDSAALTRRFYELSRQYHPDYAANQPGEAQAELLEKSALLNRAWKTFQNPDETIKYVLQQKGLLEEEEKYQLPPAFLMEVLEINERLMDEDEPGSREEILSILQNLQKEIYAPVQTIIENYNDDLATEKELLQVKEYYYKKKYLDRMRRELG